MVEKVLNGLKYFKWFKTFLWFLTFKWIKNIEVIHSSIFEIHDAEDLNDGRLGATITEPCLTCGLKWEHCPGHFGHYTFLYPLRLPIFVAIACT